MQTYSVNINGANKEVTVSADTPLLWVLRDHLQLVGTKFGCGIAQCGACTVHMDGVAMRSCILPIDKVGEAKITTIEGLSADGSHPMQEAWVKHDVPQCGYCQSGQIMTATAFLDGHPNPTEAEVEKAMAGNICRCSAYLKIKEAVISASKA